MRNVLDINRDWFYKPSFVEGDIRQHIDEGAYQKVCLPHANVELPFNYFDDKAFQFVSCYKRRLALDPAWRGMRLFLDFEGAMSYARVYVDGALAGEHKGGYTAFSVEITDFVGELGQVELTVALDSTERPDTPPFGGQIDYLTYGGIYREVQLRAVPACHIGDVFVTTPDALGARKCLEAAIRLDGLDGKDGMDGMDGYQLALTLRDGGNTIASQTAEAVAGAQTSMRIENLDGIELWDVDNPRLYAVECALLQDGREIDRCALRIGFREARFQPDGFFLNGRRVKLAGLNRHQAFPYVGYAMPARVQRRDADIMKYELGLNTVRTSHYPQSRHFLDRCDEIGLLVFEEIPGWQHIGDEQWQAQSLSDVRQMIERDRNHPSIYIWGVRINESQDHHDLFSQTNALARQLDPTRPTGGVRYLAHSEFLEDVYTMNDFIHDNGYGKYLAKEIRDYRTYDHLQGQDGERLALRAPRGVTGLPQDVPYMVTEYNGHMYPTKRYDQEERCVEHALRHARVQNAMRADDAIAGAIGWCAFDYNTHADFGSGDKICYHGVMDMFRIPKFAAYAYQSQLPPQQRVVLQPATHWARGERSIGGVIPLVVFTNCDEVEFIYGGVSRGRRRPDSERYPALPHPPVVFDEMTGDWGLRWEDACFVGYVGGAEVIRREFSRNPCPERFELVADDDALTAGDWDATRVVARVLDGCGNALPFFHEPIELRVEGAGALIGPAKLSLIGGQTAFWVRSSSGGQTGDIEVTATCPLLGDGNTQRLTIRVQ